MTKKLNKTPAKKSLIESLIDDINMESSDVDNPRQGSAILVPIKLEDLDVASPPKSSEQQQLPPLQPPVWQPTAASSPELSESSPVIVETPKDQSEIKLGDNTIPLEGPREGSQKVPGALPQKSLHSQHPFYTNAGPLDHESTIAVEGQVPPIPAGSGVSSRANAPFRAIQRQGVGIFTTPDVTLAQAENLKIAQQRILELERQVDKLRVENEEIALAGEIIKNRIADANNKLAKIENEKKEVRESLQNEVLILKGNLQFKDSEIQKARETINELEGRLHSDFRKVRVKERELENRLELMRAEKAAVVRTKDDTILDLKMKMDHLLTELENYKLKCRELNKVVDENQESLKRAVRALRLALSNLGIKEEDLVSFKKAD